MFRHHIHRALALPHTHIPTGFSIGRAHADIEAIAASWYHTMALKSDGTVWGTGRNQDGQLGDGKKKNRNTFAKINTLSGQ